MALGSGRCIAGRILDEAPQVADGGSRPPPGRVGVERLAQIYSGPELWVEAYIGYKFRIDFGSVNLNAAPQVGLGFAVWKQKKWPQEDVYIKNAALTFVPNLLVGVEF